MVNCLSLDLRFPWDEAPGYLVRDHDRVYGDVVLRRIRTMGIRDKPIAPASPWQNSFAERLIGSIRRECLDHLVVLSEAHLDVRSSLLERRSIHSHCKTSCPLYPRKRTCALQLGMSALGQ